ncbi:MAG: glycosyltransferase family 39 protein, partial [Phycisphaerae bacterium]|nr:glycosyltransferase family 39 protein [Phycisphaerae bacterium]
MTQRNEHTDYEPDEPAATTDGDSPYWVGFAACLVLAGMLWSLSLWLPYKPPFATGVHLWIEFSRLLLHDTLRGVAIVLVGVAVSLVVFRRLAWLDRLLWRTNQRWFLLITSIIGFGLNAWFSYYALDHMPHIGDEVAMHFQAKNLALGQFYAKAPPEELTPFFDHEWIVHHKGRWFGRFFVGPSLVLVPGIWLGVPWLMNPILGGITILIFYALGRELLNEKAGRIAVLLALISPFRMGSFGWMMSHGGCILLMSLFALYLIKAVRDPRRYRYWIIAAIAGGAAVHFRPITVIAMSVPLGLVGAWRCRWRQVSVLSVLAFVLPLGCFAALFLGYNYAVTGDMMRTPFELWGQNEQLGFGPDKGLDYWPSHMGRGHTPAKGLDFINMNLDAMGVSLLGWGRGTLLLMVAALCLRWRRANFLLAVATIFSLAFIYFFYYSASVIYDMPRYWSESMAFMFLLAVGGLTSLRLVVGWSLRLFGVSDSGRRTRAGLWIAAVGLLVIGAGQIWPEFLAFHGNKILVDPTVRETLARQPLTNALVVIPSTWFREVYLMDKSMSGFMLNSPNLDGDVVFARDRGDEANVILHAHFPDRTLYRFV